MAKYKCLISSTMGRRGSIVELESSHRTKELVKRKIIALYADEKPKPKPKGGKSAQDANPKEKVETKDGYGGAKKNVSTTDASALVSK